MEDNAAAAPQQEEHNVQEPAHPGLDFQQQLNDMRNMISMLEEQVNNMNEDIMINKAEIDLLRTGKAQAEQSVTDLKELIAKISNRPKENNDMKDLIKPTIFSGKDEDFHDWQSTMEDAATVKNRKLRPVLIWAKEESREITARAAQNKLKELDIEDPDDVIDRLFMLIKGYVVGEAKMICESAEDEDVRNGLEAWRLLRERYNPRTPQSENDLQNAILRPDKVSKIGDLMAAIECWEEKQRRLTRLNGDIQSESQKKHIVGTICPPDLQHHLNMKGAELKTYRDVRREIVRYVDSMRIGSVKKTLGAVTSPQDGDLRNYQDQNTEEVDTNINGLAKGGKKGDGKGNNNNQKGGNAAPKTFSGACWGCGGPHPQFLCPNGKGKGKGEQPQQQTKGGQKGAPAMKGVGKGGKAWTSPPTWGAPPWQQGGKPAWGLENSWFPGGAYGQDAGYQQHAPANQGPTQLGGLFLGCVAKLSNRFSPLASDDDMEETFCGACNEEQEASIDKPTENRKDNDPKKKHVRFNRKTMSMDQKNMAQEIRENMYQKTEPDYDKDLINNQARNAKDINAVPYAGGANRNDPVALAQIIASAVNEQVNTMNVNGVAGKVPQGGQWMHITMDSGAAENVIPNDLLTGVPTIETERSQHAKRNGGYATASGQAMPNNGEQQVALMTKEGCQKGLRFQKTGVRKPLASVSRICEYGHRVVFEKGNSYIEDCRTGEQIFLREVDGLFVLDAWVPECSQDFTRHGI